MDATWRFVRDQNVSRFLSRLEDEPDEGRRETLRKLLISEEDMFGSLSERLRRVEGHIATVKANIARQQQLTRTVASGVSQELAETTLSRMIDIQAHFEDYRDRLLHRLDELEL
jgi:hypothetical protein